MLISVISKFPFFPNETKTFKKFTPIFFCFAINCSHRKITFGPILRTTFKRGLHIRYVRCDLDIFMTDDETKQKTKESQHFEYGMTHWINSSRATKIKEFTFFISFFFSRDVKEKQKKKSFLFFLTVKCESMRIYRTRQRSQSLTDFENVMVSKKNFTVNNNM